MMEVTAETEERGAESPRTPRGPLGAAPGTASGDAALNGQETDPGLVDAGQQAETPAASGTALPPLQPPLSAESSQMEAESSQMESLDVPLSARSDFNIGASSKIQRMQKRMDQMRKLFGLPSTEAFIEDFACALKKKMLLQGRLYIFSEHVCFHCSLFGYVKVKVIPLADVSDMRKKKNVGFNNSIELTWLPRGRHVPKKDFFTSLLARGETYRLIARQWRQCSVHAPEEEEAAPDSGERVVAGRKSSVVGLLRNMSSILHRDNGQGEGRSTSMQSRAAGGGLDSLTEEIALPEAALSELAAAGVLHSSSGGGKSAALAPEGSAALEGQGQSEDGMGLDGGPQLSGAWMDSPVKRPRSAAADPSFTAEFRELTDVQCQREIEAEFVRAAGPAPPVDPAMQQILAFELPCHPLEFVCRFFSNHSDFYVHFHLARGDSSVRMSKWQRHFKVGLVRDLQFVTPVKAKIGPPQAMCHQTQRLRVCGGSHLLIETCQVMSDIPYADHFSVETRWDVAPAPGGCCVTISLHVPFSKSTIWRKFIEKGTADTTLEAMQAWKQMATKDLVERPATLPPSSAPQTEEEWGALISSMDSQLRGAVAHTRKHTRTASLGLIAAGGVPVGRQGAVLARHRRTPSRIMMQGGVMRTPSMTSLLSEHGSKRMEPAVLEAVMEQAAGNGGDPKKHQRTRPLQLVLAVLAPLLAQQRAGPVQLVSAVLAPLLALLGWLLGGAAAVARAAYARSGQAVVVAIGVVIIALQATLLLEQRHQLAQLQQHTHAVGLPPVWHGSASQATQAAQAAATLGREVARLQETLQLLHAAGDSWREQLEGALGKAGELAARLQQHSAAVGPDAR